MSASTIFRAVAVFATGLIAGIFVGNLASTPARSALEPSAFVQYQQIVHVYYQVMMIFLLGVAAISCVAWLVTLRKRWRSAEFLLAASSLAGIVIMIAITRAVNVPINEQLMTWNIASPPADLRVVWARLESVHLLRTVISIIAFVLAITAASTRPDRSDSVIEL